MSTIRSTVDLYKLLPPALKRRVGRGMIFVIIGSGFEVLGIGLIVPVMALLGNPENIRSYPFISEYLPDELLSSQSDLVVFGLLTILVAYAIKAIYLVFLSWHQSRLIFDIKAYFSNALFRKYLNEDYAYFLARNSAELIRNIVKETHQLRLNVLTPSIFLITESIMAIAIGILLLAIEPVGALATLALFLLAAGIFNRITKKKLQQWGAIRQELEGDQIKRAQEGVHGIKDMKLHGAEGVASSHFAKATDLLARVEGNQLMLSQIPRLWLEIVGVSALVLLGILSVGQSGSAAEIIPLLGLFGAAAFRLLPSGNRILNAVQQLRYAGVSVEVLERELRSTGKIETTDAHPVRLDKAIQLQHISFTYPDSSTPVLRNIDLTIPQGSICGIIGSSGAGKSTLVDIVLGLLRPTDGAVLVDDMDIGRSLKGWQGNIGYVQQSIYLLDDTIRRNIAYGLNDREIDDAKVRAAVEAASLTEFIANQPHGLDSVVGEHGVRMSGGQRQRIGIARALYRNPNLLVLDEATSALDVSTEAQIMDEVSAMKGERTIIVVTHRPSTLECCDTVYRIQDGQLIEQPSVLSDR